MPPTLLNGRKIYPIGREQSGRHTPQQTMEPKKLVEKFAKGEITEEEFTAETEKLSPEGKEELKKAAEAAKPDAVEELKSIRRGITKIAVPNDTDITKKLRDENVTSAEDQIFSKFGIDTEEKKTSFREGFKKFDNGAVNVENIMKDMKSYYASTNADALLGLQEEKRQREQEAEDFNAMNAASGGGTGGGSQDATKATKEEKAFIAEYQRQGKKISVEDARTKLDLLKNKGRLD